MALGMTRILWPTRPGGFFRQHVGGRSCESADSEVSDGPPIGEFVDSEHGHCGLRAGTSSGLLTECIATGASSGKRKGEEGRHVAGTTLTVGIFHRRHPFISLTAS
jgi:hypothetical protein